ncbi:hypothetical protein QTI66_37735 [Variovorax sp. J22R133]|uniref:hypothetical protein n=1 Tax=Variovorax brevis TaxID=3053503 RepID=UPI0025775C84|nr:hypothetical protein [Variovorax sp. J22R133]MDM0117841.1 hypothetical protein [Variovorax sp. J22R133]
MNLSKSIKEAFYRPTKWTIQSVGTASASVKFAAGAVGHLDLKWGSEEKIYSYTYEAVGVSIGTSLGIGGSVGYSPEEAPGTGTALYFLPATLNKYLFEAELPGPVALVAGDAFIRGAVAVFVGSSRTLQWLIPTIGTGLSALGPPGIATMLLGFKAVGFYQGPEGVGGAGVSVLLGDMRRRWA